jgi:hypothetical protein
LVWRKRLAHSCLSIQAGCTSKLLPDSAASVCSSFSSRATQSVTYFGLDMFLPIARAQTVSARRQARLPDMRLCGAHQQLDDPLDARVSSLHPRDERSSHLRVRLESAAWRQSSLPLRGVSRATSCWRNSECGLYIRTIRSTPVRGLRKGSGIFGPILKASMVGFTLLSRSYYTICVDEVPAPRSRPTTVRQGNGGLYNLH